MRHVDAWTLLNASVDAKNAKRKYQGRQEDQKISFFLSLRFSFAPFASTLAFTATAPAHTRAETRPS
jgi:hypothetical protein